MVIPPLYSRLTLPVKISFPIIVLSLILVAGCSHSSKAASKSKSAKSVDVALAKLIAHGKLEKAVSIASNIIISKRPKVDREAAAYWRDVALIFMDVEQKDQGKIHNDYSVDWIRWKGLPSSLRNKLLESVMFELNRKLAKNNRLRNANYSLRSENKKLKEQIEKLEKLLQELEQIK
jgi:hypothetical protein